MVAPLYKENRRDPRFICSQRAVLTTEGEVGRLCIVRNLSKGGACIAMVGSKEPSSKGPVQLAVHSRTFHGLIIGRNHAGVRCRFDAPMAENDLSRFITSLAQGNGSALSDLYRRAAAARNKPCDKATGVALIGRRSDTAITTAKVSRTYDEGWLAGRDQIDPSLEALDATVAVLNPYSTSPENERWAAGFMDGLSFAYRMMQHRNPVE